jgi:hypothetical protein
LSITGLTSTPTIFDHALRRSAAYDAAIHANDCAARSAESLFFELALDDVRRAADLFRSVHEDTDGVDGWVSLELSPPSRRRACWPIKIPGTNEGLPAIEEPIVAGVPANLTLLFPRVQYLAAADAPRSMRQCRRRCSPPRSTSEDHVEEAWRIVDPVLEAGTPIYEYEPRTRGPRKVDDIVSPPGGWQPPAATMAGTP